jgi:murein DD-endopeptidase MepM/ murein hydrolase activator NlpD
VRGPVHDHGRIVLPSMTKNGTLLVALLLLSAPVLAQVEDTTAYGGPEGNEIYEALIESYTVEEGTDAPAPALFSDQAWDLHDSLTFLPSYDVYRTWNTDAIFLGGARPEVIKDTLRLQLAHEDCDHAMPCPGHLTSGYGPRKGRMHYGVDLKLETGDPVKSAFDGMVRISKYNRTFGHVVVVRHYNGLETLYAHLSERTVEPGQEVRAGDVLGLGGNTGRSYGSHLHFEVRFLEQPIDPSLVFDLEQGTLKAKHFDIHMGTFAAIAAAKAQAQARKYHVVRRGDTLSAIARRYGTSVSALCKLNGMKQSAVLPLGRRIRYR